METDWRISFERLVIDYQPRLHAYVRHFVNSDEDAADIIQDAFLALWTHYPDREEDYPRLIYTIIRNNCLGYLRRTRSVPYEDIAGIHNGEELLYNKDFGLPQTDTPYLHQELLRQVDQVMSSLSPRCREVFSLSRMEHLKNREIARKLGISVSTVEKHIRHALHAFSSAFLSADSVYIILMITLFMMGRE